jgi:hypothetical protein
MNRLTLVPTATLAALALAVSACGDDSSSSESSSGADASSAKATALREVGETRDGLQAALATYKKGDHAAAEEQVSETYLQHFEHVEGALEDADHELNEKLEDGIREELRDDIKARKPAAEVEQAVEALMADLDKAEALLR